MMTVIIKNYDTKQELCRFKSRAFYDLNEVKHELLKYQKENDVLGLGYTCTISELGITSYAKCGNVMGNILPATTPCKEPGNLFVWRDEKKVDTGLRIGFVAYPEGYVLNTGKIASNILGTTTKAYLTSIGKRNVKCNSISDCHVFPGLSHLVKYIKKYEDVLRYLVSQYGYHFTAEYANDFFQSSVEADSSVDPFQEVNTLLDQINEEPEKEDDTPIPANPSKEDVQNEAVYRMKKIGLWNRTVNDFIKFGKIYQSEAGGIIYNLNKEALQAVEETKAAVACVPYHVIVSHTTIGTMYMVLYVSENPSEWTHERIYADGTTLAYVYNADYPDCSELGYVQVQAVNGGLVRVF